MTAAEPTRIETTAGLKLAAILHHPRNDDRGLGVVVAHGMLSSKDSDKHRSICEAVAETGATGLRFDFRGRGESDGDPTDLTVSNEVEDLFASIAFLRNRGIRRVAAVGSSLGGTVSLLAAARDRGFVGLVTIAAPARFPGGPREAWGGGGRIAEEDLIEVATGEFIHRGFFTDAERHFPIDAARRIACPWLIIHGGNDEVVPVEDAELLASANPKAELTIHPTAGHRFDLPDERGWLVNAVAGFVSGPI
jgi:dienelactone hydrolase